MAYVLDRNPCGSSSGSGVVASADLAVAAVGTETDGSVVCPSGANGLAGVKPTLGLLSRAGIVPISAEQDTAGPMTRNVTDAAVLLGAMTGVDANDAATAGQAGHAFADYTQFLDAHALEGARIGVWREFAYEIDGEPVDPAVSAIMDDTIAALEAQGATIVDPADIVFGDWAGAEFPALLCEFKTDVATYLETYTGPSYPKTLQDLIDFDTAHPELESGAPISSWNDAVFELAQATNGRDADCAAQRAIATPGAQAAIDDLMAANDLDAIVSATNAPAWVTDPVNGDLGGDFSTFIGSSGPPAVAGYPAVTVAAGFVGPLPVGVTFLGGQWSEPDLLAFAYDFEQATHVRIPPRFLASIGAGTVGASARRPTGDHADTGAAAKAHGHAAEARVSRPAAPRSARGNGRSRNSRTHASLSARCVVQVEPASGGSPPRGCASAGRSPSRSPSASRPGRGRRRRRTRRGSRGHAAGPVGVLDEDAGELLRRVGEAGVVEVEDAQAAARRPPHVVRPQVAMAGPEGPWRRRPTQASRATSSGTSGVQLVRERGTERRGAGGSLAPGGLPHRRRRTSRRAARFRRTGPDAGERPGSPARRGSRSSAGAAEVDPRLDADVGIAVRAAMTSPRRVRRRPGVGTPAAAAASWNAAPSSISASSSAATSSTTLTAQLPPVRVESPDRAQPAACDRLVRQAAVAAEPERAEDRWQLVVGTAWRRAGSLRHQPLVPDPVRLVRGGAELLVPERLVVADVALEEADLAVALEREDVGRDPVEEPAVVADHDDAARERFEARLERTQRVDVEVVRRLVEQQHVAARLEQLREVDAVALAAGQLADELLLVGAAEVERRDVRSCRHLAGPDLHDLDAVGDLLEHRLVGVAARRVTGRRSYITTVSPTSIEPASGDSWPTSIRNSVVFPAPFGPMIPTIPTRGSENVRSSISRRSP